MINTPEKINYVKTITENGTNSTMFTECCNVAICNNQSRCPKCQTLIIGYDLESEHAVGQARWRWATRFWTRR